MAVECMNVSFSSLLCAEEEYYLSMLSLVGFCSIRTNFDSGDIRNFDMYLCSCYQFAFMIPCIGYAPY